MIKIINDEIDDFLKFLESDYCAKDPFYIHICEGYDTIEDPNGGVAFGMFNRFTNHCYIASELEEEQLLKTIAHEYKHFIQKCRNGEFNENEAEDYAELMYDKFKCDIRNIICDCDECEFCEKNRRSI